ncbi:MAG: phosphomannomutase [SAR202 cluster bacterium Io17-Chloro-G9]|nr:MAG: phosphomannomutase [SAR202 cluster bacterium Io17-Chloro-G9]
MATDIRFGTDGWRGVIADDFTFHNVSRCAQGLADYLKAQGTANNGLVIGYDTRFLSREFAERVASVVAGNGIKSYLSQKPAPTPVVSFSVLQFQAAGAAIITASHNPAIWNGFKFKPEYAGSATQDITDRLEQSIDRVTEVRAIPLERAMDQGTLVEFDPAPHYLERVGGLVDLAAIRDAGLRVSVDAMFGAGGGYIPALVSGGKTTVEEINGYRNPSFPGMEQPEPIAHNLTGLIEGIKTGETSVGLALDGDADRVGVVDEHGRFITTLEVFSLLALYLLEHKGERGPLVKGVTSSMMLNKLGQQFGVDIHEMKVGFKYIGPKMSEVNALMGGEESGGFAFRGHIPERDGVLSALYILEYMAKTGLTPSQLVQRLFDRVGSHYYHRRDVTFDPGEKSRIEELLRSPELTELAGMPVRRSDEIDGRRFVFDDAWLISRFSGTEPLLRIYAEAGEPKIVEALLDAAANYLKV